MCRVRKLRFKNRKEAMGEMILKRETKTITCGYKQIFKLAENIIMTNDLTLGYDLEEIGKWRFDVFTALFLDTQGQCMQLRVHVFVLYSVSHCVNESETNVVSLSLL